MAEGYFSDVECAGGCGNLLPQRVVDAGKRYLWGHKNGCPKDGEPARRSTSVRSKLGMALATPVETSYARTLEIVKVNVELCRIRCEELVAQTDELIRQREAADAEWLRHKNLQSALEALLGPKEVSCGT